MKILINNEEVVCSNELTISEEMLTTSSTILNNCYPKSWEQDHDYISRFYYPKDYSKCLIYNKNDYIPGTPGIEVSGTNLEIDYDENKEWDFQKIKGDTYQQTYSGKNLNDGINDNFYITSTATGYKTSSNDNGVCIALINGTYTISTTETQARYRVACTNSLPSSTQQTCYNGVNRDGTSDNITIDTTGYQYLLINATDIKKIQIEKGNQATTYEEYVGGVPSPNPDYPQEVQTVSGLQTITISNSLLPDEYRQVDYIENTSNVGNQWIDTNVIPTEKTKMQLKFRNLGVTGDVIVGYRLQSDYTDYRFFNYNSQIYFDNPAKNNRRIFGSECLANTDYNFEFGNFYVKDLTTGQTLINGTASTGFTGVSTIKINYMEYGSHISYNRIYSLKIYNDDTLIRDFIPCYRVSDNEVGLYDLANNQFYENQGTGNFVYGEVVKDYDIHNINLGKNMLNASQESYTLPANENTSQNISTQLYLKSGTKYYISYNIDNASTSNTRSTPRLSINGNHYYQDIGTNKNLTVGRKVWEFTPTITGDYTLQYWLHTSNVDLTVSKFMVSTSSDITYSPYKTPIELCKIGDNQDFIDGTVDDWYINKYVGKIALNGSESTWSIAKTGTSSYFYRLRYVNDRKGKTGDVNNILSNNYSFADIGSNNEVQGFTITSNNELRIRYGTEDTLANFKTWLSTHNTNVYYILATPTRTKITDSELVSQLNALAQAQLYNGYNNITVSGDLKGQVQIYYNYTNPQIEDELVFSGVVKNTGNMSLNPRDPHYATLQVLDFKTMLSEGDTLDFVINNKTIPEAIQMVVDAVSTYGVVVGNIEILNPDEIIGAYSTVDKTAYDVLQYLSEIAQAKWTTRLVDENTIAVDFYDPTLMPQAEDIEYTQEYFEANNIENIEYNYGTYDYRNKQIITSDQVYGSIDYIETILADGYNKIFNTTQNIGIIKSIYVDGVAKSYGTQEDKELGIEYDFYYTPGQTQFESNENEPVYSSNSSITITYTPLVKGRQVIYNNDEVERISSQTNRNGIISRYENRNDVLSTDELISVGQTYIKYKGSAEINLIVSTYNFKLFEVGQLVYFNAPIEELKQTYMVKQKEITTYTENNTQQLFCKYTLTSSFNSEREVNYFDNQRNKAKGNISVGDYITRNVDIEKSALIEFNNLVVEEITSTGDNILNSALNSPLNN